MAPIKLQHVVSFTSQDPKHPVENLLNEDTMHPWLNCPRDRNCQLKVELQLEKASLISYIDIGNSGSAFVQIDVGRSSWPSDRPFVTLLPTSILMAPSDAKSGKNRSGVRMFKEGDFISEVAIEKWDRLRIICSQPFNKQDLFGLSFIRLRSTRSEEDLTQDAAVTPNISQDDGPSPLPTPPLRELSARGTAEDTRSREEKLKDRLQQVLSSSSAQQRRPAAMSRTARMVISAAKSRKRCLPATSPPSPLHIQLEKSSQQEEEVNAGPGPVLSASCPDTPRTPDGPSRVESKVCGKRSLRMRDPSARSREPPQPQQRRSVQRRRCERPLLAPRSPDTVLECSSCPLCGGYFRVDYLPIHASTCGEDPFPDHVSISSSSDDASSVDLFLPGRPQSWVTCPVCGLRFGGAEIQQHASSCGE
ncbi:protein XNDC1N [Pelodytes ibericus]